MRFSFTLLTLFLFGNLSAQDYFEMTYPQGGVIQLDEEYQVINQFDHFLMDIVNPETGMRNVLISRGEKNDSEWLFDEEGNQGFLGFGEMQDSPTINFGNKIWKLDYQFLNNSLEVDELVWDNENHPSLEVHKTFSTKDSIYAFGLIKKTQTKVLLIWKDETFVIKLDEFGKEIRAEQIFYFSGNQDPYLYGAKYNQSSDSYETSILRLGQFSDEINLNYVLPNDSKTVESFLFGFSYLKVKTNSSTLILRYSSSDESFIDDSADSDFNIEGALDFNFSTVNTVNDFADEILLFEANFPGSQTRVYVNHPVNFSFRPLEVMGLRDVANYELDYKQLNAGEREVVYYDFTDEDSGLIREDVLSGNRVVETTNKLFPKYFNIKHLGDILYYGKYEESDNNIYAHRTNVYDDFSPEHLTTGDGRRIANPRDFYLLENIIMVISDDGENVIPILFDPSLSVGISNNLNDYTASLTISPNPSKGNFVLDFSEEISFSEYSQLKILSSKGQTVFQQKLILNNSRTTIETKLNSGVYVLLIVNELSEVVARKKLIIQ